MSFHTHLVLEKTKLFIALPNLTSEGYQKKLTSSRVLVPKSFYKESQSLRALSVTPLSGAIQTSGETY